MRPRSRRLWVAGACLGLVAIVGAVAVVTAFEGNLFWLRGQSSAPSGCGSPSPTGGNTPLGSSAALGTPREQVKGPNHWYNFSVQSAGGGIAWGDIRLQVVTAENVNITPTTAWTAVVTAISGPPVATYDFVNGTWSEGAGVAWTSLQTLSIDSGTTNLSAAGDMLNVLGVGCFQGSISVNIP